MDKFFCVGTFCFHITGEDDFPIPSNFLLFESDKRIPNFAYHLNFTNHLYPPQIRVLANRKDLTVYKTEYGESRLISVKGLEHPYAYYQEISDQAAEIFVNKNILQKLKYDTIFASLFALERHIIRQKNLILHCAYVKYRQQAILFSGPSGTGKSTQAALWEQYRNAHTVNGDRALLRKSDDRWMACGWPVCGSSNICEQEETLIQAIVILRQGEINHVERLSSIQAFRHLYSQVTINQWNKDFVQQAACCIEDLITKVPVWLLTCDISEKAVQSLESAIFPFSQNGGDYSYEI